MANSVVHFEIFATNVERARAFYERAFGWRFEAGGPPDFYLLETGTESDPGLTRGLLAKRSAAAAPGGINAFRCTISVRSIKDAMSAVEAAGGKLRSPSSTYRTLARWSRLPIPRTTSFASSSPAIPSRRANG